MEFDQLGEFFTQHPLGTAFMPYKPLQTNAQHGLMYQANANVVDAISTLKSRTGALDTRTYQDLVPLHLPSKLRDRITKAQRRAAAEKDGVSLFTANVASTSAPTEDASRSSPRSRKLEENPREVGVKGPPRHRESMVLNAPESAPLGVMTSKEKLHLPDVIIGHKMREFEAKMNLNALFVDPLENNLHHLSIDDKEKVMLRMQDKIQGITAQIDSHFIQLKQELDANGIFDSAANYQRAQALCLVELQKRCKLDKLRDEAMKEVLDENGGASHAAMSLMEGKLNDLLAQKHRDSREQIDSSAQMAFAHLQKGTKSSTLKRRPAAEKRHLSPVKRKQPHQPKHSNQLQHDNRTFDESPSEQITDVSVTASAANAAAPIEDWTSRHPHVALVLQLLLANGGAAPAPSTNIDSLDSFSSRGAFDDESTADANSITVGNPLLAEAWHERSSSYQVIATRAFHDLLHRWARWRWDSTRHFHTLSNNPLSSTGAVLPDAILRRLLQNTASARLREDEEHQHKAPREQTNAEKCKRAGIIYQELQEGIQARRYDRERRQQQQASSKRGQTPLSRLYNSVAESANIEKNVQLVADAREQRYNTASDFSNPVANKNRPSVRRALVMSASAPVVGLSSRQTQGGQRVRIMESSGEGTSAAMPEHASPRPESRRLQRNRELPLLPQHFNRRSRSRQDSLIGAPALMDLSTLGHFSNARLEERRSTAQTWAWLHPHAKSSVGPHISPDGKRLRGSDDDDEQDSDVDASERRDAMGRPPNEEDCGYNDDGDSDQDSDDDRDSDEDTRSVRSSVSSRHLLDSARSSFGVMSKTGNQRPQLGDDGQGTRRRSKSKNVKSPKRGGSRKNHSASPSRRASATHRGPRGSRLLSRPSNSSNVSGSSGGMFAGVHFTANAQVLQHRLEELWIALDFPFSAKLAMLEKYANFEDPDMFSQALGHWESAAEIVVLLEKLKHILSEYEELDDVKVSSRLTPADWSYVLMQQVEIPPNAINLSSPDLVEWIRLHLDVITQRCEKMAQHLKANTGDELTFQGQRYPPRL